jgi:hypothetical protein
MSLDDIRDPRGVPRWLEVGISGVPRQREWDLVSLVDVPELEGAPVSEVSFRLVEAGRPAGTEPAEVPAAAVARLSAVVEQALEPPCEVRALRRGVLDWSVAARRIAVELVDLPSPDAVEEVAVAVTPDGERTVLVDGEESEADGPLAELVAELEQRGRARFPSFVARAVRSSAGWEVTVDPL